MEKSSRTLGILFFLRKERTRKDGKVPIYLRITVDGKRTEYAIKRYIEPSRWNQNAGLGRGTVEEIKSLNDYIRTLHNQILNAQKELIQDNKPVTATLLKNKLLGIDKSQKNLLDVFSYHNQMMSEQ